MIPLCHPCKLEIDDANHQNGNLTAFKALRSVSWIDLKKKTNASHQRIKGRAQSAIKFNEPIEKLITYKGIPGQIFVLNRSVYAMHNFTLHF